MFDGSAIATISVEPARLTGIDAVLARDLLGDQLDHVGIDLELVEVDRGDAVLLRDEVGELVLVEEAELGDLRAEAPALRARLLARLAKLLRGEQVLLDEQFADPLVHRSLPSCRLMNASSPRAIDR